MNRVFHEYIRAYISESHLDWDTHLYTAQFAVNNSISEATGCSPAFLTFGFNPKSPHSAHISKALADTSTPHKAVEAIEFIQIMNDNLTIATKCLQSAQDKMKTAYDKHRRALLFSVGDLVMLRTTHITLGGKRKFLPKFLGPFPVTAAIGVNAYRLELPPQWKIHDVFNVSLLKPYYPRADSATSTILPDILDDFSYSVESILAHRYIKQKGVVPKPLKIQYHIHFLNTASENDSWDFIENIPTQFHPIIHAYHADNDLPPLSDKKSPSTSITHKL
jgi:hypothetical protein